MIKLLSTQEDMKEAESSEFLKTLQRRDTLGCYEVAYQTVRYLKKRLADESWDKAGEAIRIVENAWFKNMCSHMELSVGNMVRRVLKIVKEEYYSSGKDKTDEKDTQDSLQKLLLADNTEEKYDSPKPDLPNTVISSIEELLVELETSAENVCAYAQEYIQTDEVIMTVGNSRLVERFLKTAAKKKKFQVVVIENAPECKGHDLARSLIDAGIHTAVCSDAAVFAMMSRCNKVIIGTRSVMADGGLKAVSGTHTLALAAKHYSVPVIVLAPMYKLSPQYLNPYDQDQFNYLITPHKVMAYSSGEIIGKLSLACPLYDYVPPHLISLYATNIGGYAPSYIYRLLADLYHPDDYILEDKVAEEGL